MPSSGPGCERFHRPPAGPKSFARALSGERQHQLGSLLLASCLALSSLSAASSLECDYSHGSLHARPLPPPIEAEAFFSTRGDKWGFQVSPDGRQLLWLSISNGVATPHVRSLEGGAVTIMPAARPVSWAYWAADSRHLVLWRDHGGNENYRPWVVDAATPHTAARPLIAGDDVRVFFQQQLSGHGNDLLVRHNRRDRAVTDLYRVSLETGVETRIEKNPGTVDMWVTDRGGVPVLRRHRNPDFSWRLEVAGERGWQHLIAGSADDYLEPRGNPPAGASYVWALSNRGRDRVAVVKLSLEDGVETIRYEHPEVDVAGLLVDERSYEPFLAWAWPGYQHLEPLHPLAEEVVEAIPNAERVAIELGSWSDDKRAFVITTRRDLGGQTHYLYSRGAGTLTELNGSRLAEHAQVLARMEPISFQSRDGLMLHGYLTLPRGEHTGPLPTVLHVHGGPFARDRWGFSSFDQLLANRGYAVLRVNFRGSTGYGRAFMEAARREFAGKMHEDLIDGVNWLVAKGISDPERVAIYGHSYGGYAALVGLTKTPRTFAAAIDVMGPAELIRVVESGPAYWRLYRSRWYRFIGHPDNVKDRADMAARSPINYLHRVERPLLVAQGANDVRVPRSHSDRIVSSLRARGMEVEYLLFDGEGHRLRGRHNQIKLALAVESFLGRHLGGRVCQPSRGRDGLNEMADADSRTRR